MADNNIPTEWYLARDGQQHGPVSEVELEKIIELGYLRPSDLVWRQGMAEWGLAETVIETFARRRAAAPPPSPPAPSGPAGPPPDSGRLDPSSDSLRTPASPAQDRGPSAHPSAARQSSPAPSRPAPQQVARQPESASSSPEFSRAGPASSQWEPHPVSRPRAPGDSTQVHQGSLPTTSTNLGAASPGVRPRPASPKNFDDDEPAPRGGFPWRVALILLLVGSLGGGVYALHRTGQLTALPYLGAPQPVGAVPVVNRPAIGSREIQPAPVSAVPSAGGFEQSLQRAPLWQRLKRDFPDWHKEVTGELGRMAADSRSERELQAVATRALIELRKRHHTEALTSSPPHLRAIAQAFVANLSALSRESISACYGFISQGEASPAAAELQSSNVRASIDSQLGAIFDAVVDSRQRPSKHEPPRREDYDALTQQLGLKGWSPPDLQLFMDARALSRAAPEKVCQMVQDWFAAQLAIEDEGARTRLLSESLKPVVAG